MGAVLFVSSAVLAARLRRLGSALFQPVALVWVGSLIAISYAIRFLFWVVAADHPHRTLRYSMLAVQSSFSTCKRHRSCY